jgi:hypothetical protein
MDYDNISDVQKWMQDTLINPAAVDKKMLADILLPGPRLGAAEYLAIYQRSYSMRLKKCLAEQFPATLNALGDGLFADFADAYLQAYPSESYTLYELGRRFPLWLEETRPDRDRPEIERDGWVNFMVDLAHYERVLFHCFDTEGHEGKPWPNSTATDESLQLQPCFELAQYRYPVAWYYHEVRAGQNPKFPQLAPSYTVILRNNYQTLTYPVSALHYKFLSILKEIKSIPAALEAVAQWAKQPVNEVIKSWQQEVRQPWIEAGFFIAKSTVPVPEKQIDPLKTSNLQIFNHDMAL